MISGASGFIGRQLALRLRSVSPAMRLSCLFKDDEDAFCRGGAGLLVSDGIQSIPVDLSLGAGLDALEKPAVLFHLAANTHTWESDHSCNDKGTENLMRALQPLGPMNHIVFTSTTAVMDNRNDLAVALQITA